MMSLIELGWLLAGVGDGLSFADDSQRRAKVDGIKITAI